MKKILLVTLITILSLTGCSSKTKDVSYLDNTSEIIKIYDLAEIPTNLDSTIYKYLTNDIEENDYCITDLDIENMEYEITKAREVYDDIDFELLKSYRKSADKNNLERDDIEFSLDGLEAINSNFNKIIDLYEKMIYLGSDKSYNKYDYEEIEKYRDEIVGLVDHLNLYFGGHTEYIELFASFAYDLKESTISDVKKIAKNKNYKYEVEEDKSEYGTSKTLTIFDNESEDKIKVEWYKSNDSKKFNLIWSGYYIGDTGSTLDIFISEDTVSYGGFNKETGKKPEFDSFEEQYEFLQDIKEN